MERISAAIARAKQTRRDAAITVPGRRTEVATDRAAIAVAEIRYTATSVIPVDPDHLRAHKIFAFDQEDPRALRFDMLRTQVLQAMDKEGLQTLGVISPTGGCGKTVISINLALAMARQYNHTVLLVDFDLKKPSVANYLGLERRRGLKDFLDGAARLDEVMVNPGFDRMVVLPNFERVRGSSERMMSDQIRNLVSELKARYRNRIVIFDLPPLLETDDVIAFLPLLDCSLMVAAIGRSSTTELEECEAALEETRNLGVVLNKSEEHETSYAGYPY